MEQPPRLRVAILGSGNIGTDLLIKTRRSRYLECSVFIGRNAESPGLARARKIGVEVGSNGIRTLLDNPSICDLVFDATSAAAHLNHDTILRKLGKPVIDLTPSRLGAVALPAIKRGDLVVQRNLNMVSCGGQASAPLAYAIARTHPDVDYIEVVSSIASLSAGPATRANIDEYIEATENALRLFSGCPCTKAILILNPSRPPIHMQTTISARVRNADIERLRPEIQKMVAAIRHYVPGYEMIVPPVFEKDRIVMTVRVTGLGDYLPPYAGNLDIINCAALATAEDYSMQQAGRVA